MAVLTKFQRATVNRINEYFKENNKYLLADEVGLGKTIIAQNVLQKFIKDYPGGNAYYVCGNLALAKSNLNKLMPGNIEKISLRTDLNSCNRLSLEFIKQRYVEKYKDLIKVNKAFTLAQLYDEDNMHSFPFRGKVSMENLNTDKAYGKPESFKKINELYDCLFPQEGRTSIIGDLLKVVYNQDWAKQRGSNNIVIMKLYKSLKENYKKSLKDNNVDNIKIFLELCKEIIEEYSKEKEEKIIKQADVLAQIVDSIRGKQQFEVVSLTPGTSISMNGSGILEERILAYEIIRETQKIHFDNKMGFLEICTSGTATGNKEKVLEKVASWKCIVGNFKKIADDIVDKVIDEIDREFKEKRYCVNSPDDAKKLLVLIRKGMAIYSLTNEKLTSNIPDNKTLVIMDEFQNYSELFKDIDNNKESEMSLVSSKLLNNKDVKVLMLSATPFKYSTKLGQYEQEISKSEERDKPSDSNSSDEVFADTGLRQINQEFNSLMSYIGGKDVIEKWENTNKEKIERMNKKDSAGVKEMLRRQEELLYSIGISRVERNNNNLCNNKIVVDMDDDSSPLLEDLLEIPKLNQKYIDEIKDGDTVYILEGIAYVQRDGNYYPMSYVPEVLTDEDDGKYLIRCDCFREEGNCNRVKNCNLNCEYAMPDYVKKGMDDSEIKRIFKMLESKRVALSHYKDTPFLFSFSNGYKTISADSCSAGFKIDLDALRKFNELTVKHLRFQELKDTLLSGNENLLLFIPPSKPHYKLSGIFKEYDNTNTGSKNFYSKTLIFSHYNHTPKALSALLSYESSRKTVTLKNGVVHDYWGNENIGFIERKPVHLNGEPRRDSSNDWNIENEIFEKEYSRYLEEIKTLCYENEVKKDNNQNRNIMICGSIVGYFYDFCKVKSAASEGSVRFKHYVKQLSLRIYKVFETSDAYDILNLIYPENLSYHEKVWRYCTDGNIRAVLDEYIAMIYEDKQLHKEQSDDQFDKLLEIFTLATENMNDQYVEAETTKTKVKMWTGFARGHYSGDKVGNSSDANTLNRKIAGFNSPFRPFVFITTSVGQEGFDFHWYCRNIVHWSLTFDPVKFEQRDGRINRYHCHYIRQNAALYSNQPMNIDYTYWEKLFDSISKDNAILVKKSGGLYPHWEYPLDNASKLQRYAYYYPESREKKGYDEVVRACSYYRALLGQPQDDNSYEEKLKELIENDTNKEEWFINLAPYKKKKKLKRFKIK